MIYKFVSILSVILFASVASAQHCRPVQHRVQEVVTPIFHQDVIVQVQPIFVPVFQFQYQPTCVMPAPAAQQPAAQQPTYGANDDSKMRAMIKSMLEEMMAKQGSDDDDGPPDVLFEKPRNEISQPQVPQRADVAVLEKHCYACHTGGSAKKNFRIFDGPGLLSVAFNRQLAWSKIASNEMPPAPHHRLTEQDKVAVKQLLGIR